MSLFDLSADFWTGFFLALGTTLIVTLTLFTLMQRIVAKKNSEGDTSSFSSQSTNITNGYWFFFEHEGIEIVLHRTTYLGTETVYVNDNPVSTLHNFLGLRRSHEIMLQGKSIRVVTDFVNVIGYRYECSVYVGRKKYHSETKGLAIDSKQSLLNILLIPLASAAISFMLIYAGVYLLNQV